MPPEVAETARQVRKWLLSQPKVSLALGAGALLVLGWLIYVPLLQATRRSQRQWLELRRELISAHEAIDPVRSGKIPLPPSSDKVASILEQLNHLARSHQIELKEVSPGSARPGEPEGLLLLPIELQLEGRYRSMGEFLGALRQTPSLESASVRGVSIHREEKLLPALRARVSLELALSRVFADGS